METMYPINDGFKYGALTYSEVRKVADMEKTTKEITSVTVLTDEEGDNIKCPGKGFASCSAYAMVEYLGFCPKCWIKLTAEQRAILKGQDLPLKELIVKTTKEQIPPPGKFSKLLELVWRAGVVTSIVYLYKFLHILH